MTSMERMQAVLHHQKPDRTPAYPILAGITRKLVGADYPTWSTDAKVCADAYLAAADRFDLDCLVTLIDLSIECDAWGQKIIYPMEEAAHPDYDHCVVQDVEDYDKVQKVDWRQSARMQMHVDVIRRLAAEKKGKLPIIAFVFGPLGTLSMLRGQQNLYLDLYDDPEAVQAATGRVAETLAEFAEALCDAGADAIMWDTLFASGSIMSPQMWHDTEFAPMQMLAKRVEAKGCMNMIHNCGQKPYFAEQIAATHPAAISFLHPASDCADFAETRDKYGPQTALIGCVPPPMAITGTDEEWEAACREQMALFAEKGGFVLATGCEYPSGADFARAESMIRIAKEWN